MNEQRHFLRTFGLKGIAALAAACWLSLGLAQQTPSLNRADLEMRALQAASTKLNAPLSRLTMWGSSQQQYTGLNLETLTFEVRDTLTGRVELVVLTNTGDVAQADALLRMEQQAYFAQYGRMDTRLAHHLSSLPPNQEEMVIIWLKEPVYTPLPEPTEQEIQTLDDLHLYQSRTYEHRSRFVRGVVSETLTKLQAMGYDAETNDSAPVLYANLPVATIRQLSEDTLNFPEIDRIYKPDSMVALLDTSRTVVMADVTHFRNIEGNGVRTGMVEARQTPNGLESGRVAAGYTGANAVNNNPFLLGTTINATNLGAGSGNHATNVAGVIRMLDIDSERYRGIAPWVSLWAGGGNGTINVGGNAPELETALNNAIGNGGGQGNSSVVNMSFGGDFTQGTPGAHSRFADTLVFNNNRTLVVAAGNSGLHATPARRRVNTPGDAYNVVTVGNMNDNNTVRWDDDSVAGSSSFGLATNRMKPELIAPGTNIKTTTTSDPWAHAAGGVSGTSFAAPHVTGAVALMIEARPFVGAWPELVKAILMCNALHNVTNAPGNRAATGALIVNQSVEHAANPNANMGWATGTVQANCNPPAAGDWTFTLNAGQRLRFVMCWKQNPNWANYTNQISADYDLALYRVVNNQDQFVIRFANRDDNFEILDYTVPNNQGGQYKVKLEKFRCGTDNVEGGNTTNASPGRRAIAYRIDPKQFAYINLTTSAFDLNLLGQAAFTATLRNIQNNAPLANKQIRFRLRNYSPGTAVDIAIGNANTNAQGVATLNWNIPNNITLGRYRLVAEFQGDNTFEYTAGGEKAFIYAARMKIEAQNQTGTPGQAVTLRGRLICLENNQPIANKQITFTLNGSNIGTAITNANGFASINYNIPPNYPAGAHRLSMYFDGDLPYGGGYGESILAVNRQIIQGKVQLEFMAATLNGLTARIVVKQGANTETVDAILDGDGNYTAVTSLSGANATVSARIFGGTWLRKRLDVANLTGVVTLNFNLLNGDANKDNRVDDEDLLMVLFNFGLGGPNTSGNLNRDASVNDNDLLNVLFNFGIASDPL